jgi:serine/threonine-protein kinase ULK/ATG1
VVKLYECIETNEYHYLVMEYCKYGDLHDYIKTKPSGTLAEEEAMDILVQILNGFKGLHEILVIHRDIKLRNILVAENCRIKIADFGLSKISEEGIATTIVGTPYTKAPEVFSGKRYDNKADIWSLGVIFYQMLFKLSYPYTAKIEKALFDNIK